MLRPFAVLGAVALAASPAAGAVYSAKPTAPMPNERIIARNIVWACGPDSCVGSTDHSRPLVLCQGLAKKAGRISSFIVDGRAISAAELDRCNASARPDRNAAVATVR